MASLTGQSIANTYDSLLKLTDNEPLTSSLKVVTDGLGNSSVLQLSTVAATLTGALSGTSATFSGATTINTTASNPLSSFASLMVGGGTADQGIFINSGNASYSRLYLGNNSLSSLSFIRQENSTGNFEIGNGGSTRVTIPTTGNVLIGTSTDAGYKLDVNGTGRFSGSVTSDDLILTAGTLFGTGITGFSNRLSDTTLYLQMPASGFNITDNALNSKFILSSTGAATFSADINAIGYVDSNIRLAVNVNGSNTAQAGPYLRLGSDSQSRYWIQQMNASYNLDLWHYNSSWGKVGSFDNSTGVYTALSDINKKKDFQESEIGLNAILGLKPTLYRMKTESNESEKHLGFIAQEVKNFIPQAYTESGDEENKFIGLNEMPIIAALVKAIQEQQSQIEELKLRIK